MEVNQVCPALTDYSTISASLGTNTLEFDKNAFTVMESSGDSAVKLVKESIPASTSTYDYIGSVRILNSTDHGEWDPAPNIGSLVRVGTNIKDTTNVDTGWLIASRGTGANEVAYGCGDGQDHNAYLRHAISAPADRTIVGHHLYLTDQSSVSDHYVQMAWDKGGCNAEPWTFVDGSGNTWDVYMFAGVTYQIDKNSTTLFEPLTAAGTVDANLDEPAPHNFCP